MSGHLRSAARRLRALRPTKLVATVLQQIGTLALGLAAARPSAAGLQGHVDSQNLHSDALLQPLHPKRAGEMVETPHGVLEMPEFGLSEAEKAYHGPPDDRRALMAHRKWLQVHPVAGGWK